MTDESSTTSAGADDSEEAGAASSNASEVLGDEVPEKALARRSRWNRRVVLVAGLAALIGAAVVLPPLINIGRYQHRIAAVMTRSFGRPVHMSGVELRLLPRPGFVLHDLAVSEDPAFGAEPVLSARTVVASVRILSLWRGHLAIDRVSVDEASLNLVRSAQGRWNLESLLMGAQPELTGNAGSAANQGKPAATAHLPYLEATDSRVNLKNGVEKSPFSLVGTDLSLWQDEPGVWRVRLRGQPVRTDMEISLADTGQVRMEATLKRAAQLRDMPLQLQMEWRDAQLGQLSRLLLGSDAGWRGDLTADIDVEGTADRAQTKARLRATGVRREEFAPDTPLDFDANCNFRYQHSLNAVHDLGCNTAIGDGQLQLKAELPGAGSNPRATLAVKQVPLQAGLDLLRTVRSGFAPGISIKGTATGSLTYNLPPAVDATPGPGKPLLGAQRKSSKVASKVVAAVEAPPSLQGALIVDGAQLRGGELKEPLMLPRMTLAPASMASSTPAAAHEPGAILATRFTVLLAPAGGAPSVTPSDSRQATGSQPNVASITVPAQSVSVQLGLGAHGYDAAISGSAAIARLRELAYAFGVPHFDAADGFTAGTADFNLDAAGPWIASSDAIAPAAAGQTEGLAAQDSRSGSLELHHAQWKAAYLARPVELAQSMVTLTETSIALTSDFAYGPAKDPAKDAVRGTVQVNASVNGSVNGPVNGLTSCNAVENASLPDAPGASCQPQVQLRFGALDAAAVQMALLGAPEERNLFSPLVDRMRSTDHPKWPEVAVNLQADSLALGPATLLKPAIQMQLKPDEIVLESWQTSVLGGSAKGSGHFAMNGTKPEYAIVGSFSGLNGAVLGALLNAPWSGGPVSGKGSVTLSGLNAKDLAASAAGTVQFDWLHGTLATLAEPAEEAHAPESNRLAKPETKGEGKPQVKSEVKSDAKSGLRQQIRFDEWSGTLAIQDGKAQLGENEMQLAHRSSSVTGGVTFGGPVRLSLAPAGSNVAAQAAQSAASPASGSAVK